MWGPNQNTDYNLRWGKGALKSWNVGLDFVLFHSMLSGGINWYQRKQRDLLGNYNVAYTAQHSDTNLC